MEFIAVLALVALWWLSISVFQLLRSYHQSVGQQQEAVKQHIEAMERLSMSIGALNSAVASIGESNAKAIEQVNTSIQALNDIVARTGEANAKAIERVSDTIETDIRTGP